MALKWKRNGTAKCGPFKVEKPSSSCNLYMISVQFGPKYIEEYLAGVETETKVLAWLRAQPGRMRKDLGGR